ncbi:16S rRNA (cytidine1402-2'-O)-methyltransferase [Winogradskyella epiphytica]|uniref:16S rRNA (Cytidine1402-2'-O)-methyltransferase n=1 Tax=Winogradskyella epiphytica TaxID=262005 RepID=A0A2V4XIK6_9FLAO|nr:SAM-dependent methyltransferase [Winogradskyella epiphytica]PYE81443.1 16S rRNA (cytidine1402-2'-O)-methyltransferase [Winogradskyella epiphytica]GGW65073.1 S-adenosylmethionine-dependent methyltransferase [Winogradskyella epiphytica]
MSSTKGKLYLIPTRLGDTPPLEVLPMSIKKVIEDIDHYIVENEKTARRFIKRISPGKSQPSLKLQVLNKYTTEEERNTYLNACLNGLSIGLLSEAGCPAIADPGADIVKLAHQMDIRVIPLVGPSSIILALMASGMNGQSFTFNGYLPIDKSERKSKIKHLEKLSLENDQAQIFIETPYRNMKMIEDLAQTLHPNTRVCVACDLTLPTEFIKTLAAKDWKHHKEDLHKRPAIFIIQKD